MPVKGTAWTKTLKWELACWRKRKRDGVGEGGFAG